MGKSWKHVEGLKELARSADLSSLVDKELLVTEPTECL